MFNAQPKPQENEVEKMRKPEDVFKDILRETQVIHIDPKIHQNEKGELLTENGEAVSHLQNELHWKIVRTPSFKKWFGNSVVKDENGEPKVVYRSGLEKSFDIKNPFPSNAQTWQENHYGTFFTSHRKASILWFEQVYSDTMESDYDDEEEGSDEDVLLEKAEFSEKFEKQVKVFSAFIKLENPYIEKGYERPDGWGRVFRKGNPKLVSIGDFTNRVVYGGEEFLEELRSKHDGLYLPHSTDYGDEYAVIKTDNILILPSDISFNKKEEIEDVYKDKEVVTNTQQKILKPKTGFWAKLFKKSSNHHE